MSQRSDYTKLAPGALRAMYGLEKYLSESSIEPALRVLIKLRHRKSTAALIASMHSKDARAKGESEQRLYGLVAWWETPFYTERERAARHRFA